jgi:hypothetical protein
MAAIIILLGGIIGFGTAVTAYSAFGASLLTAVLIWAASGPVSALIAALAVALQRTDPRTGPDHQVAANLPETA